MRVLLLLQIRKAIPTRHFADIEARHTITQQATTAARTGGPFAPTPVLHLLRDAASLLGGSSAALVEAVAAGYPRSLQRRPAQLLRSAHAVPNDLDRLLTAAGFADLDDLRRQAGRENGTRLARHDLRYTARGDSIAAGDRAGLERTLRREQDNLAETLRSLHGSGALELAARAILRSRRRWVFGDLKSRGYAHLFASDLTGALSSVTLIDPTAGSVTAALGDAHHLDSLTVFCFRRYSRLSVRVAERYAALGTTVVAITDSEDSPVAGYADHVLHVATRSEAATHSPTAVTAVGHVLASLAAAGAKGAARRERQRQELALAMDWYVS